MIPGWSPTKIVQTDPVGCLSRSRGQKVDFQKPIFKILFVLNYKAQSFYIWHIALLEVFYQSCSNYAPGVKIDHVPEVTILH